MFFSFWISKRLTRSNTNMNSIRQVSVTYYEIMIIINSMDVLTTGMGFVVIYVLYNIPVNTLAYFHFNVFLFGVFVFCHYRLLHVKIMKLLSFPIEVLTVMLIYLVFCCCCPITYLFCIFP